MSSRSVFLINKWLDPIFAIGVGVWAYGLYEREHPRADGHTLQDLVRRRYGAASDQIGEVSAGKSDKRYT